MGGEATQSNEPAISRARPLQPFARPRRRRLPCPSYVKEIRFTMEIEVGGPLKFPACRGVAREQGEGMESDMNGINLESEERERERGMMTQWIRN